MAQKATQLYDFTLAAFGSQVILADANFYKILTSTGDVQITRDGGSRIRPMSAGRGEREVEFLRLQITDISGAPNSGTIVVGDSNFIDDTIVLSSSINVRPEQYSIAATVALNAGAVKIVDPASNPSGLIVISLDVAGLATGNGWGTVLAKNGAPASLVDGAMLFSTVANMGTLNSVYGSAKNIMIPAGKGLYFFGAAGTVYSFGYASVLAKAL